MEKYANEKTIIKNEAYNAFKDAITCQICLELMIEPAICLECQNTYCKKCIEDWKEKKGSCPSGCNNPDIKDVINKNNLITKFKFKCIRGCGEEILFKDLESHYSTDCVSKKNKFKILTREEVIQYKNKIEEKIDNLTSK